MTQEQAAALAAFINAHDPRYEARPLYGTHPCVMGLRAQGNSVSYYSIADYVQSARQEHSAEFQSALEKWLSGQQGRE